MEEVIFKRRNRLKNHFVTTSNVLLYGYHSVSDAAKITFQVIDGFDWESANTGDSKGYVFPATQTLAKIRHISIRTVQRHIKELVSAGLLSRKRQRNKPSILLIEDVSEAEKQEYLATFVDPKKKSEPPTDGFSSGSSPAKDEATPVRNDKNDVSQPAQTTKMSFAYTQKEKEATLKEKENNVNEKKKLQKRGRGPDLLAAILKSYRVPRATHISAKPDKIAKRDYLAETLADALQDRKSLGCYRVLAEKIPQDVLFQLLGRVKETGREGRIRQSRGALFVALASRYAAKNNIALAFKRQKRGQLTESANRMKLPTAT